MDKHRNSTTSSNLTNFALEHGFTFSQAKHNWYDVIVPTLKEEEEQKTIGKQKYSAEITQNNDCTDCTTEESEEEEPKPVKSSSKVSKVVGKSQFSYLKPFKFETHKNRFYVFSYNQDHLLYEFKEVSLLEKNFTILVKVRGLFTLDYLEFCLGDFFDMAGGVENTQCSLKAFTLTEYLPKDVDLKSVQYGENYHPDFGPIFVVTFDKKVNTFVPVKQALWSTPKPVPTITRTRRLSSSSESCSSQAREEFAVE